VVRARIFRAPAGNILIFHARDPLSVTTF